MKLQLKKVANQPSWILRSKDVELAVTQLGGQMAPVTFYRNAAKGIQPYYISPWQSEDVKLSEPVLVPLRGDFFCMPFGVGGAYRGEQYVVHGAPATRRWSSGRVTQRGRPLTSNEATEATYSDNLGNARS